jgi:hypothetical protein
VALAMIFSSYRIIPAALTFFGYAGPFLYGFPSVSVFWKALTDSNFKVDVFNWSFMITNEITWWEVDHYISIVGLVVILYFGVWVRFKDVDKKNSYRALNIPLLIFVLFTFGNIFEWIALLQIPLITVERVSARFLILPILTLLALSCIWMQRFFEHLRPRWSAILLTLIALSYEGYSLIKHFSLWRETTMGFMPNPDTYRRIEPHSVWAKSVEEYYIPTVQISYLISLTTILVFVAGSLYLKRKGHASYKEV